MSNEIGVGNVHTHHLDLRVLPENISKQQGKGVPEWMNTGIIGDLLQLYTQYMKRFRKVMNANKNFNVVSQMHVEDMDEAEIDFSVILHIDFEGADPKAKDKNYQFEYVMDKIAKTCAQFPFRFFPFFGFDPRRPGGIQRLETNWEHRCFVGIKLYPATGFDPRPDKTSYTADADSRDYYPRVYKEYGSISGGEILGNLKYMYLFAKDRNLPIITHCSPGGTFRATVKKSNKYENIWRYTNPGNFKKIAKDYGLRIGFAHNGGKTELTSDNEQAAQWREDIFKMIREADGWESPGRFYSDESYEIIHSINSENRVQYLEKSINRTIDYLNDTVTGKHVLFGTDWPLNIYKCTEKQYTDEYRKRLNNNLQKKYFSGNIARFLFGESKKIPGNYVDYIKEQGAKMGVPFRVPPYVKEENGDYYLR